MRIRQSAFTLIEILVALAIMVIVVGCAYGIYFGATRSATRYRARNEVERDARALLRMMGREVRCSYFPLPSDSPTVQSAPAGTSAPSGTSPTLPAWEAGLWAPVGTGALSRRQILATWGRRANVVLADGVEYGGYVAAAVEANADPR